MLGNFEQTFKNGRQRAEDVDVLFGLLYELASMVESNKEPRALLNDLLDEAAKDLESKPLSLVNCGPMICAREHGHPGSHMDAETLATASKPIDATRETTD